MYVCCRPAAFTLLWFHRWIFLKFLPLTFDYWLILSFIELLPRRTSLVSKFSSVRKSTRLSRVPRSFALLILENFSTKSCSITMITLKAMLFKDELLTHTYISLEMSLIHYFPTCPFGNILSNIQFSHKWG